MASWGQRPGAESVKPGMDLSVMQSFWCDSFHPVLRPAPLISTTKSWDLEEDQNRTELTWRQAAAMTAAAAAWQG